MKGDNKVLHSKKLGMYLAKKFKNEQECKYNGQTYIGKYIRVPVLRLVLLFIALYILEMYILIYLDYTIEFPENTEATFDYSQLSDEQKMYMASLSQEELSKLMQTYTSNANATYDGNLKKLGAVDLNKPSAINIYPKDFDSKEFINALFD